MSLSKNFLLTIALASQALAAPKGKMTLPDFTKGDPIPNGANHDWNLGATGARGWMFSDKMVTSDARQIIITKVAEGSPAIRILEVGGVILGVNEKLFSYDPRTEFGKALTTAEASGQLPLVRWRDGKRTMDRAPLDLIRDKGCLDGARRPRLHALSTVLHQRTPVSE